MTEADHEYSLAPPFSLIGPNSASLEIVSTEGKKPIANSSIPLSLAIEQGAKLVGILIGFISTLTLEESK